MPLDEGTAIKVAYGRIGNVLQVEEREEEFYMIQVFREGTLQEAGTDYPTIPLEQTPEELASLYGPPSSLIGRRVRIDYTGRDFESGVARIVADVIPGGGEEMNQVESRGFRYAVPGGSGLGR